MAENNYDASMIQAFEGQDAVKEATFNSFIIPYIEIAKMKGYGANFTEKVILNAKNRYNTMINDDIGYIDQIIPKSTAKRIRKNK